MNNADLIILASAFFASFINRQSLIFLCAFALCETLYYSPLESSYYALTMSLSYAYLALIAKNIRYKLQMALIVYSVLYWFASLDYLLFTHETYFYVIFPYIIKAIDIYVISQLIKARGQYVGNTSAPRGHWI